MVPGGGAMFLVDALGRAEVRPVSAIHEQGAGAMAMGYAMASGGLGVCLVTSGPGATNALTPCYAVWSDSIPVLFISGQSRTETLKEGPGLRTHGLQNVDIIPMVRGITKYADEPMTPLDAIISIQVAIGYCLSGRYGPAWLSVPQDIQGSEL